MTLYRKYRPQKFMELYGQDHIRDTLIQAVKDNKLSQAYLFSGPRGTGKTSTARLIAKVANCLNIEKEREQGEIKSAEPCGECANCIDISESKSMDIIEIDAASNRGIDEIRQLRDQVRFAPTKSKYKVYIIDEVHMLTREAFNALLKTLEEPPSHAIFILATTEPHKVLPTIISRTQRFDFGRISLKDLADNLEFVAKSEGLKTQREALEIIAQMAEGGGRDSLSLLEQVASFSNDISVDIVKKILGLTEFGEVLRLIGAIFNCEAEEGLKIAQSLYDSGSNVAQLNTAILGVLRKVLNWLVAGEFLIDDTTDNKKALLELCQTMQKSYLQNPISQTLAIIREFLEATKNIKESADPLIALEVAIIGSVQILQSQKKGQETNTAENIQKAPILPKKVVDAVEDNPKIDPKDEQSAVSKGGEQLNGGNSNPLIELTEEIWGDVVGKLKKENTTLAALLKDAKPITVESGKVVLGVRFKFHKDKISEAKNIRLLEGVICSVTKSNCQVMCEIANFSEKPKKAASDDELAEEAEKVFGE